MSILDDLYLTTTTRTSSLSKWDVRLLVIDRRWQRGIRGGRGVPGDLWRKIPAR
jgi:hypothetical protein